MARQHTTTPQERSDIYIYINIDISKYRERDGVREREREREGERERERGLAQKRTSVAWAFFHEAVWENPRGLRESGQKQTNKQTNKQTVEQKTELPLFVQAKFSPQSHPVEIVPLGQCVCVCVCVCVCACVCVCVCVLRNVTLTSIA